MKYWALPNLAVPIFSVYPKEDVNVFFNQLENIAEIYSWSDRLTQEKAHVWAMELEIDQRIIRSLRN